MAVSIDDQSFNSTALGIINAIIIIATSASIWSVQLNWLDWIGIGLGLDWIGVGVGIGLDWGWGWGWEWIGFINPKAIQHDISLQIHRQYNVDHKFVNVQHASQMVIGNRPLVISISQYLIALSSQLSSLLSPSIPLTSQQQINSLHQLVFSAIELIKKHTLPSKLSPTQQHEWSLHELEQLQSHLQEFNHLQKSIDDLILKIGVVKSHASSLLSPSMAKTNEIEAKVDCFCLLACLIGLV